MPTQEPSIKPETQLEAAFLKLCELAPSAREVFKQVDSGGFTNLGVIRSLNSEFAASLTNFSREWRAHFVELADGRQVWKADYEVVADLVNGSSAGGFCFEESIKRIDKSGRILALHLKGLGLVDVNTLARLEPLSELDLSSNSISDISVLKHLVSLESLDLSANDINCIADLSALTCLKRLILGHCKIEDISPLSSNEKLTSLSLEGNNIADISALRHLNQLSFLNLTRNPFSDVTPLVDMPSFLTLWLSADNLSEESKKLVDDLKNRGMHVSFHDAKY